MVIYIYVLKEFLKGSKQYYKIIVALRNGQKVQFPLWSVIFFFFSQLSKQWPYHLIIIIAAVFLVCREITLTSVCPLNEAALSGVELVSVV